jgi:hypothetical protein
MLDTDLLQLAHKVTPVLSCADCIASAELDCPGWPIMESGWKVTPP